MRISLISFLFGIIFSLSFFLFSGGILMPKVLKVNSIEIIDNGNNQSGYIIIKNKDNNIVSYLGVGKNNRGIITLKDEKGNTKINIGSNNNGGYIKGNDMNSNESFYIDSQSD